MEYKILFVDDDLDILEMLCSIFRRAGYTDLVTASSGPEALRGWREQQPALIVLDVMMPGMDGFEVLREIRRTSHVPILMLTARGEAEDRIEGLEIRMVLPRSSHSARMKSRTSAMPMGSRPLMGSSKINSSGSCITARAIASRCFIPREYWA